MVVPAMLCGIIVLLTRRELRKAWAVGCWLLKGKEEEMWEETLKYSKPMARPCGGNGHSTVSQNVANIT